MGNREIKFRIWGRGFHTNKPCHMFGDIGLQSFDGSYLIGAGTSVDYEESNIMQYTGLEDKNGVEIYEGDILQVGNRAFEVKWHIPTASFVTGHSDHLFGADTCEIIGNIYEHPHLLDNPSTPTQ